MNKTIAILSLLATSAVFAETTVDSGNEFSFVPVTGAAGLKAIAVPVAGYSAGEATSIKVAEILQTTGLSAGDKLYTLGDDGKYSEYTLTKGDEADTWTASRIVTVGSGGAMTTVAGTPAADATLTRGKAFWLNTRATSVYLLGQAATTKADVVVTGGGTSAFKYNLVGPSTAEKVVLNAAFGADGDRVILADGTTYARNKSVWKKLVKNGTVTSLEDGPEEGTELPAGTGFWYLAKGEGTKTLSM